MVSQKDELIKYIRNLGFDWIGFAKSKVLDKEAVLLENWLNQNYHGEMNYLERYFDMRIDPDKLVPGTNSIIVLGINYYQDQSKKSDEHPNISNYAYGKDYHQVIRSKTKDLIQWMRSYYGDIIARSFVDSGPVMERVWANEAGLSWSGKNTLSINPKSGSYFFLSCILTDLKFEYDHQIKDYCGTCRRCIDACPTDAFHADGYVLDASKCISYLTIELKNNIPESFHGKMNDWIFGCDICQQVCPWNRFSTKTKETDFEELNEITNLTYTDWLDLREDSFQQLFKNSPLKRAKLEGIKKNIRFIKYSDQ